MLVGALIWSASDYRRATQSYVANLQVASAIAGNQADLTKFVFEALRTDPKEYASVDYKAKHARMIDELNQMDRLYERWDNLDPVFSKVVAKAREFTRTGREFFDEAKAMTAAQQLDEIDDNLFLRRYMMRLYQTFQSFMSETSAINEAIFSSSKTVAAEAKNSVLVLQIALGCNLLLLAISAYLVSRQWGRRLEAVSKSASLIAQKQTDKRMVPGTDEIASIEEALIAASKSISDMKQRETQIWEQSDAVLLALDRNFSVCSASPNAENFFSSGAKDVSTSDTQDLLGSSFLSWLDDKVVAESLRTDPSAYLDQNIVWSIFGRNCSIAFKLLDTVDSIDSEVAKNKIGSAIYSLSAHDVDEQTRVAKMRALLVSMISHDVRIPLGSVRNSIQMRSAAEDLPPMIQQELDECERECNLIIETINNLLEVDKIDREQSSILREFVSLLDVLEDACSRLDGTMGGVKLGVKDVGVVGDYDQFVRLFCLLGQALISLFPERIIAITANKSGSYILLEMSVEIPSAVVYEPTAAVRLYTSDSRVKLAIAIADRYDVAIATSCGGKNLSVKVRLCAYDDKADGDSGHGGAALQA